MSSICLVRHGETTWNSQGRLQGREDIPLNDRGRARARDLAEALASVQWDLLVSSPLRRTRETATIIGERLGLPKPLAISELMERDYGAASGLTKAEANVWFPDGQWPGAETRADVHARCWPALEQLAANTVGQSVIVVTHGSVIKTLLLAMSKGTIPPSDLKNACHNLIRRDDDGHWQIAYYNRTANGSATGPDR